MKVIRDPKLWFAGKPRPGGIDTFALHWTGGVGDENVFFRNITRNKCSIHYYVRWDGLVWQMADEARMVIATNAANPNTIAIEVQSPGYPNKKLQLTELVRGVKRKTRKDKWGGRMMSSLEYTPAQIESIVALVTDICDRHGIPKILPRNPGELKSRDWLKAYRGGLGHNNVNAEKDDPGPHVWEALLAAGFTVS